MKFKVNTKLLGSILHPLAKDVAAKGVDQVSIRIVDDGVARHLILRSVIPAIDVTAEMPILEIEGGLTCSICAPASVLCDYLDHIDLENVEIEITDDMVGIHQAGSCARFPVFDDEFPETRQVEGTPLNLRLSSSPFRDALTALLPAAAVDGVRPQLSGVHIETREGIAELVCTDSRILVLERMAAGEGSDDGVSANIAAEVAKFLAKVSGTGDDTQGVHIEFGEDGAAARANVGPFCIVFPLVKEKYPDYRKIIGADTPLVATVSAAAFRLGLNLAQVSDVAGLVQLDFKGGIIDASLVVTSEDLVPGAPSRTTSTFPCEYGGEDLSIAFPRKRMIDGIKALDCQDVEIRMKSPRHAAFLSAAHREEGEADRLVMLMPMMKAA